VTLLLNQTGEVFDKSRAFSGVSLCSLAVGGVLSALSKLLTDNVNFAGFL